MEFQVKLGKVRGIFIAHQQKTHISGKRNEFSDDCAVVLCEVTLTLCMNKRQHSCATVCLY